MRLLARVKENMFGVEGKGFDYIVFSVKSDDYLRIFGTKFFFLSSAYWKLAFSLIQNYV